MLRGGKNYKKAKKGTIETIETPSSCSAVDGFASSSAVFFPSPYTNKQAAFEKRRPASSLDAELISSSHLLI